MIERNKKKKKILKIQVPELQGEPEEISSEKCKLASQAIEKHFGESLPVICEDTSLCYNALSKQKNFFLITKLKRDYLVLILNIF